MGQSTPYREDDGDGLSVVAGVEATAVLEAYVKVLESSEKEVRPAAELPFGKDMIKSALIEGLEAAEGEEEEELLEAAFLALAWFQPLSPSEESAVAAFDAEGDAEAAPEALETEETLAESGALYAGVLARIERESQALRAELADAGYGE